MAAEKEKELFEQKVKELQEQLEDQKKDFEDFVGKMVERTRQRQKISAGTRMGSAHNGVGRFLQCPLGV